ncbi:MAG TPA: SDR family oxidoreductase [Woeseiaceae bacterium]|nr:SDR family oxidoreductase [Woeseiaceae bacterium]
MSVLLVTGASSGIGAAVAIAFAEAGWDVMASGRDEGRLDELAEAAENIVTWAGALESSEECDELVADTLDEFGQIDCLVNSAGLLFRGDVTETDDDDWRETFAVNLDIPFYLSRAALPHLQESAGTIVNIACASALRAERRSVAYATAKAGLVMLTKAMARDHAADGVRVNAVCPGPVDTPLLAAAADEAEEDVDGFLERLATASPNGRVATPEDVAAVVRFLASAEAAHITGAVVPVDGGLGA